MNPLRRQALRQRRQQPKSVAVSVQAPVGGWNTRDSVDSMPPQDAFNLDNFWPTVGKVSLRKGYTVFATGVGGSDVKTLAEYHSGTTQHLIAAGGGAIYECSGGGAATSKATGFSENEWDWVQFNNTLLMFNGTDAGQNYDGSTVSANGYTGIATASLKHPDVHRSRVYLIEKDSQSFWYSGVNSIAGALTEFDLSRVGKFGGNLVAQGSWTHDGGSGADDFKVFIMSSGEVVVYSGGDPGSDFTLVGVYRIGVPINHRSVLKVGGDMLITTTSDYVSLSEVLRTGQIGNASKLSGAVIENSSRASNFGWQLILHQKNEMILSNVPQADGSFDQHGINTLTGAATRFKDLPARTWAVFNNDLYFGDGSGQVCKYTGNDDNGSAIQADAEQAWNDFGNPQTKRCTALRPVFETAGTISYEIANGYDYERALTPSPSTTTSTGSPWDTSPWDTSPWSAENVVDTHWRLSRGAGQNISTRVRINSKKAVSWLRTDYRLEQGRNL